MSRDQEAKAPAILTVIGLLYVSPLAHREHYCATVETAQYAICPYDLFTQTDTSVADSSPLPICGERQLMRAILPQAGNAATGGDKNRLHNARPLKNIFIGLVICCYSSSARG
jgi:hypothetical protein